VAVVVNVHVYVTWLSMISLVVVPGSGSILPPDSVTYTSRIDALIHAIPLYELYTAGVHACLYLKVLHSNALENGVHTLQWSLSSMKQDML